MSQALSITGGHLRENVEDLVLSPALTRAMVLTAEVSDDVRAEALAMLQRAERRGAGSGFALAFEWIALINLASAQPMTPGVFAIRGRVVAEAVAHWPEAVITKTTAREVMSASNYFPSVKVIDDVLRPHAVRLSRMTAALRGIVEARPPAPSEKPENQEDRDSILEAFRMKLAAVGRPPARSVDEMRSAVLPPRSTRGLSLTELRALRGGAPAGALVPTEAFL